MNLKQNLKQNSKQKLKQNLQHYLDEIQTLKKQLKAEKLSHENSLKQLECSYEINEELKEFLKKEQNMSLKLKMELQDKHSKLTTLAHQYEQQISHIKQMIQMKDDELRRISSALMVNDYDVIRLKIVNELELIHKEQIEGLSKQILKMDTENIQLSKNKDIAEHKTHQLEKKHKELEETMSIQNEELANKYIHQINTTYALLQVERNQKKVLQRRYDSFSKKHQISIQYYQSELANLQKQLEEENISYLSNGMVHKKNKDHQFKEQGIALREQVKHLKENVQDLSNQLLNCKKTVNQYKKRQFQLNKRGEYLNQELDSLKNQLLLKQDTFHRDLNLLKKQHQRKMSLIEDTEGSANSAKYLKQLQKQNNCLKESIKELESEKYQDKPKNKEDQNEIIVNKLKEEIKQRQIENNQLKIEIKQLKSQKKPLEDGRTRKISQKNDEQKLRAKLKEANEKIVDLLKEKIQYKQIIEKMQKND